jgi:hypothetical protein
MTEQGDIAKHTKDSAEIDRLNAEIQRLGKYEKIVQAQTRTAGIVSAAAAMIWIGPKLSVAVHNLVQKTIENPSRLPARETADVITASIRRTIRVGLVLFLLALVPGFFTAWQSFTMNQQLIEQRKFEVDQQVTQHMPMLFSSNREEVLTAITYF